MDNTLFERHASFFVGEIGMYYCGKRIKTENHVYGPEIRSHFLLVLVNDGTACLHHRNGDMKIAPKQLLVMFPNERIYYEAESRWSIQWVGVAGNGIEGILEKVGVTRDKPILEINNFCEVSDCLEALYALSNTSSDAQKYKRQATLYNFFAALLANSEKDDAEDPVSAAVEIIKYNFSSELKTCNLASRFHLERSYFSRLFKERTGLSPKQYVMRLRMEKAKEYLAKSDSSVKEISFSTGFADPLYFSAVFTKHVGMSPIKYRECFSLAPIKANLASDCREER